MDVLAGLGLALGTVVVVVVVGGVVAFAMLFARRGDRAAARAGSGIGELSRRAGSLLVRLDDAVRDAEAEVGYALAQFGSDKAEPFARAVADAQSRLAQAFRLRQLLDDAEPDSDRQRREWTLQIIALCEQAESGLAEQDAAFRALRFSEAGAAGTVDDLRRRIADVHARIEPARAALDRLAERFAPGTLDAVRDHPERAAALLRAATEHVDAAAAAVASTAVTAITDRLTDASTAVRDADRLLDAVDRVGEELTSASAALDVRRDAVAADLVEARRERDAAPDPDSARAILEAIAGVEAIRPERPEDPVRELERLAEAVDHLDLALAASRNQADRLAHARAAFEGGLVTARSQIAVARELIASGGAGVDARTRLAEAERQFALAQSAADPVEALDTIRRAEMRARDAEDLARYDRRGGRP